MALGLWLLIGGVAVLIGIFDREATALTGKLPVDVALPMIALGAALFLLPLPIGFLIKPRGAESKPR